MRYCDLRDCTSSMKSTARLVAVCRKEQVASFEKRQIPISIEENLMMKLQFDDSFMAHDHQCCNGISKKSKIHDKFINDYKKLTVEELTDTLCVPISQIKEYLLHSVSCIGCRTSIDNFIKSLMEHRHPGLEPLIVNEKGWITVKKMYTSKPDAVYTLLYVDGTKLQPLLESIPRSKKSRRCVIHSLDRTKSINDWEIVWDTMSKECHEEITLVEGDGLLDTIETYLRKHKFCSECKLKVIEAYDILMDTPECKHRDRKGFCPALYEGLRSCPNEKHVHVEAQRDFICNLIARAEPDIEESRRERHAKTLDVAQEEILTCIGIYLFERFDKIYRTMRSEEQTWQLLFYISIDCLRLNFEKAVDRKQDFGRTLEQLCEEFRVADEVKAQQKQQKRSKRKARRKTKANEVIEERSDVQDASAPEKLEETKSEELVARRRTSSFCSCLCHYCDQRSNSLSIIHTTMPSPLLAKSQSCPSLLLATVDASPKMANEQTIRSSSSLETLFSSISTSDCVCHDRPLTLSTSATFASSSMSCIRCSSTRTDPGYSSGQDDTSSFGPCECSIDGRRQCCPLHEVDENNEDSGSFSHNCCVHDTFLDTAKPIELHDRTRQYKLKLQLSSQYPFFEMALKHVWVDTLSLDCGDTRPFISDEDIHQFSMLNKNVCQERAQLRHVLRLNFQAWKQRSVLDGITCPRRGKH